MSEPYWTLVQCWTNVAPTPKQISSTVTQEAKTGQMSDALLASTALTKIGTIQTTLELHGTIFLGWINVGPALDQCLTSFRHRQRVQVNVGKM